MIADVTSLEDGRPRDTISCAGPASDDIDTQADRAAGFGLLLDD
jgi:hypothetical protein